MWTKTAAPNTEREKSLENALAIALAAMRNLIDRNLITDTGDHYDEVVEAIEAAEALVGSVSEGEARSQIPPQE